jgi:dethiobiotin synthase
MKVFVTGTDTDVGKTIVSSLLVKAWKAKYWKPIQTGLESDPGDTRIVQELTLFPNEYFMKPSVELLKPLSPWRAGIQESIARIDVRDICLPEKFDDAKETLIIEGAGGLYVPINESTMMGDLICELNTPVILVGRSGLGTINHTLLSIEYLKRNKLTCIGIILNGELNSDNVETIETLTGTKVIAQIPKIDNGINSSNIEELCNLIPPLSNLIT